MQKYAVLVVIVFALVLGCSDDDVVQKDSSVADSGKDISKKSDAAQKGDTGKTADSAPKGDTGKTADSAPATTLSKSVQPILTASCAGAQCHGATPPKAGLNLTSGKAHAALVGVASKQCSTLKLVQASDASKSYLVQKIEGSGGCFKMKKMPIGGSLTAAQVSTIKAWITAGAKNN